MYKVVKDRVVEHPTKIHEPVGGGEFRPRTVTVKFLILPRSEVDKYQEAFESNDPNTDWVLKVVKGWRNGDFIDEADQPIEYSEENLKLILNDSVVRVAFVTEYFHLANGGVARRKNSR